MHDFTPWSALIGGAMIGLAASLLLVGAGRVAGVSGIFAAALFGERDERPWRLAFLGGLCAVGLACAWLFPGVVSASPRPVYLLAVAGLFVGFGTQMGEGCTSGHGVCGVSRLSGRSLVATALFVASGVVTATLVRLLGVGQ